MNYKSIPNDFNFVSLTLKFLCFYSLKHYILSFFFKKKQIFVLKFYETIITHFKIASSHKYIFEYSKCFVQHS